TSRRRARRRSSREPTPRPRRAEASRGGTLKACSTCQRLYESEAGFCPIDGARLDPVEQVAVPSDPEDRRIGAPVCGGRYEIRRKVADGGMGRVYQARDLQESRSVALKILHSEVAGDAVAV